MRRIAVVGLTCALLVPLSSIGCTTRYGPSDGVRAPAPPLAPAAPFGPVTVAWTERLLQLARRCLPAKTQLALMVSLEHFTAVFADLLLGQPRFTHGMHPEVRELWLWHAVEETEHKAVAFGVYQAVCGSYWLRILMMTRTLVGFPLGIAFFQLLLLWRDRTLFDPADLWRGLRFVWGRGGLVRSVLPQLLRFYRRDLHPWQHDNRHLVPAWVERSGSGVSGG